MYIIGIGHKARQGKNTLANEIVKLAGKEGWVARTFGFADALKAYARVAHGMTSKNPRLLQVLGTDVFRETKPGIWLTVLRDTLIEASSDGVQIAVIPDVRFEDEADMIRYVCNGTLVKIIRTTDDGAPMIAPDRPADHPSEVALEGYWGWSMIEPIADGDVTAMKACAIRVLRTALAGHETVL